VIAFGEVKAVNRVRRRTMRLLRTLQLPAVVDLPRFVEILQDRRGREIFLMEVETKSTHPCGLWLADSTTDYVLYERHPSPSYQRHIIWHEFGHILFSHGGVSPFAERILSAVLPEVDVAAATQIRSRTTVDDTQEAEAEMFATLVGQGSAYALDMIPSRAVQPRKEELQRLAQALELPWTVNW
jgi:hypothetical protein